MSPAEARAIESKVLQEKEEELRARLELLQSTMVERRSAEEWQATKSAWLNSIRDLNAQLEQFPSAGAGSGAYPVPDSRAGTASATN